MSDELMKDRYPKEDLTHIPEGAEYWEDAADNGTMSDSRDNLEKAIVGHKIVDVRYGSFKPTNSWYAQDGLALLLDNGHVVWVAEEGDCCAYTSVDPKTILKHIDKIDHVITGVGTTNGFTEWHIYADLGDVLDFSVSWSAGNPFYYGYGFTIQVFEPNQEGLTQVFLELEG